MNDDELKRLLQGTLSSRRLPAELRERLLLGLRRRHRQGWLAMAAAALLVTLLSAALLVPGESTVSPFLRDAVKHHREARTFGHSDLSSRELTRMVEEACGREIELPSLRDGGFVRLQAHGCENMGGAHVVYANSWLTVSCFVVPSDRQGLDGGRMIETSGVQARVFDVEDCSVVVVRTGTLSKVWVADLKPAQLSTIAMDTELKKFELKTTVFTVTDTSLSGPLGVALRNTPGVEDVQLEDSRHEAYIRYDRRRVTPDDLAAMMVLNGFPAGPREWGGR
jgi:hypothetical protein